MNEETLQGIKAGLAAAASGDVLTTNEMHARLDAKFAAAAKQV